MPSPIFDSDPSGLTPTGRRAVNPAPTRPAPGERATTATPLGWSSGISLFERFEFENNRSLGGDPDGSIYGPSAGIRANARRDTETTTIGVDSEIGGDYFFGDGAGDEDLDLDARVGARVERRSLLTTYGLRADVSSRPTSVSQVDDSDVFDDANQFDFRLQGDLSYQATRRDDIRFSTGGEITRFFSGETDLDDTEEVFGTIAWAHQLSPVTETQVGTRLRGFFIDDDDNTNSYSANLFGGVNHRLSESLRVDVIAGATYLDSNRDIVGDDESYGFEGRLGLDYRISDLSAAFSARQALEPSALGEVQNRTSVDFTLGYRLDEVSRLTFRSGYAFQKSADGFEDTDTERHLVRLSPGYQVEFTEWLGMRVGYDFRLEDEADDELETSHGVFVEFTQDIFTFP